MAGDDAVLRRRLLAQRVPVKGMALMPSNALVAAMARRLSPSTSPLTVS